MSERSERARLGELARGTPPEAELPAGTPHASRKEMGSGGAAPVEVAA